jgi:putative alpha-1,2-mannosidase
MNKYFWRLVIVCICTLVLSIEAVQHPEEMVNLLTGSFTDGDRFSTGNTLPLVGRPWGFNHWAPMTGELSRRVGSWWFKGSDHIFTWMRCTHQPSPWIGDWGWFVFGPQLNYGSPSRNPVHYWEPRAAVMKPYLFDATVAPFGIRIELTPTDHCAYVRTTFPVDANEGIHIVLFVRVCVCCVCVLCVLLYYVEHAILTKMVFGIQTLAKKLDHGRL